MKWADGIFRFNQYERDCWVARQSTRVPAGVRVLDVAAGTGPYRSLFTHCEYRAHDFGKEPGTVGKYTKLDYESDVVAIPVPDESFDLIVCTEVLEHVPEPILAVKEMARILKQGGRLLITAPLGSFLHQEPYHFYGGYTPWWYRKILPEAGLQIESIEANRGFFSWFGQEAIRFSALVDPRRTRNTGWRWFLLTALWLVTVPLFRGVIPLVAQMLDQMELEHMATVGYHVVAVRK